MPSAGDLHSQTRHEGWDRDRTQPGNWREGLEINGMESLVADMDVFFQQPASGHYRTRAARRTPPAPARALAAGAARQPAGNRPRGRGAGGRRVRRQDERRQLARQPRQVPGRHHAPCRRSPKGNARTCCACFIRSCMASMGRGTGQVTLGTVGEFRLYKPKAL